VYCTFVLLPLTYVLYVRLITFDSWTVRSSCYLWLVYCTFKVTRWTYSTQVKSNKTNVQYTSQRYQDERTVHRSKATRWTYSVLYVRLITFDSWTVRLSCYLWPMYCTFVLLPLTRGLYVRLITFDLCTVRSSCYLWPMYCTFVLLINKVNVQYTSQKQQAERTVHKSKVTRRTYSTQLCVRLVTYDLCTVRSSCYLWLVYCTFVLLPLTCVLYVHLVTFDLCTVLLFCYFWPMYYAFVLGQKQQDEHTAHKSKVTRRTYKTNVQYIGQM
jgi:hypothetical protein